VSRPTVLLFDIDGTLVTTGGAGRRAIDGAFEATWGRRDACSHFSFDGMTDRAIARGGLAAIGVEVTDAAIDQLLAEYVRRLEAEVRRTEDAQYRVHAGMREAVQAGLRAGMAVGLGTGNVREGARVKLERVNLFRHFTFGGFGDDHEARAELIRVGAERGAAQLGVAREEARVVVVGDTPKDVAAAQAIGAECVGVATGSWSVEQLRACGATWAFGDLTSEGALDAVLLGGA
jgi:phosphoglycolate phosphatase